MGAIVGASHANLKSGEAGIGWKVALREGVMFKLCRFEDHQICDGSDGVDSVETGAVSVDSAATSVGLVRLSEWRLASTFESLRAGWRGMVNLRPQSLHRRSGREPRVTVFLEPLLVVRELRQYGHFGLRPRFRFARRTGECDLPDTSCFIERGIGLVMLASTGLVASHPHTPPDCHWPAGTHTPAAKP